MGAWLLGRCPAQLPPTFVRAGIQGWWGIYLRTDQTLDEETIVLKVMNKTLGLDTEGALRGEMVNVDICSDAPQMGFIYQATSCDFPESKVSCSFGPDCDTSNNISLIWLQRLG